METEVINLPLQLWIAAGMFVATILMHLGGLTLLVALGRIHLTRWRTPWLSVDRFLIPLGLAAGVAAIHVVEVTAYAWLFDVVGATATWEQALFYSLSAYSTAGVGGLVLEVQWRVLGAAESLNGILLIGWSTAFLFETLHRIMNTEDDHPFPMGAIARRGRQPD